MFNTSRLSHFSIQIRNAPEELSKKIEELKLIFQEALVCEEHYSLLKMYTSNFICILSYTITIYMHLISFFFKGLYDKEVSKSKVTH